MHLRGFYGDGILSSIRAVTTAGTSWLVGLFQQQPTGGDCVGQHGYTPQSPPEQGPWWRLMRF